MKSNDVISRHDTVTKFLRLVYLMCLDQATNMKEDYKFKTIPSSVTLGIRHGFKELDIEYETFLRYLVSIIDGKKNRDMLLLAFKNLIKVSDLEFDPKSLPPVFVTDPRYRYLAPEPVYHRIMGNKGDLHPDDLKEIVAVDIDEYREIIRLLDLRMAANDDVAKQIDKKHEAFNKKYNIYIKNPNQYFAPNTPSDVVVYKPFPLSELTRHNVELIVRG